MTYLIKEEEKKNVYDCIHWAECLRLWFANTTILKEQVWSLLKEHAYTVWH